MAALLEIKNITSGYGQRKLVTDFSAKIEAGRLIALIGENGSGKSTLLRNLSGKELPINGSIHCNDQLLKDMPPRIRASHISFVAPKAEAISSLDVLTAVTLGRYAVSSSHFFFGPEDESAAMECLRKLDCEYLAFKQLHEISDGEFQKVMIARALAQSARLMILDEPTAFLDFRAKNSVMEVLKSLCKKESLSVLFSSHDLDLVDRYADEIWYLHDTKITVHSPTFASELSAAGAREL